LRSSLLQPWPRVSSPARLGSGAASLEGSAGREPRTPRAAVRCQGAIRGTTPGSASRGLEAPQAALARLVGLYLLYLAVNLRYITP
jgi:hypothetical protein